MTMSTTSQWISIHSLPKEGDPARPYARYYISISIHSLPKEGDQCKIRRTHLQCNFNPLPPQGGRQLYTELGYSDFGISIHSLPKEGDLTMWVCRTARCNFNPLPPQGGRHADQDACYDRLAISIHSLPKEGDKRHEGRADIHVYFNPLPPQGGRLGYSDFGEYAEKFQSTPSPRRETTSPPGCTDTDLFQSTPSPRRETSQRSAYEKKLAISIHSLPKEGDRRNDCE